MLNYLLRFGSATLVIAFIAMGLPATPAFAQAPDATEKSADDFHITDDIVVTAPYFERLDFLAGTSSLAGEELAQQARGQLGDSLTSLPGVSTSGFARGASRPVLRGFQGNRVAVLTDGIGNIDASNTSADHAVTIEALTVERVEVLRGPAVLLFGGQAVGGAVNVIDKRIPRKLPEEAAHADALLGYASVADEYSGGASVDVPVANRFVIHADGSYRKSNDARIGSFLLSPPLRQEALDFAERARILGNAAGALNAENLAAARGRLPNSSVETWTMGLGGAFIDTGGNVGMSVNLFDTRYGVVERPNIGAAPEEDVAISLRQYRFDLRGEVALGDGLFKQLRMRTGYANYEHQEVEGDEVSTRFLSKAIETRIELAQNDRSGWRGASGLQYQTRDFEAIGEDAFLPPTHSDQIGLFTLQEFSLGRLEAELALRLDRASLTAKSLDISRKFTNVSAAIGLGYVMDQIKIGLNLSHTGRAPSVEELYSNGPHVATQSFEIGDTNLRSERSWNGEIYARYDSSRFEFSGTIYTNRFSNFIYQAATGLMQDDLPVFQYVQRKSRVWGFEAEASANVAQVGAFDIIVDGVTDYVRANVKGQQPLPRIPPLRLLGGLELQSHNLDLRGEVEWSDDQTRVAPFETATQGFTTVNVTTVWRPFGRDRNISLIAEARNLFDVDARRATSFTKDFAPMAGRDFRLTARFSF